MCISFLDLDGDLPPILVSLVTEDEFSRQLLDEPIPRKDRDRVKGIIEEVLHSNKTNKELMVPLEHRF